MRNKGFMIIVGGAVAAVITFLASATDLLPSFLVPFVLVLYPLYIVYMVR